VFSCRRAGSQEAPEPGRTFFWSCTRLPRPQAARGRPRDRGCPRYVLPTDTGADCTRSLSGAPRARATPLA